MMEEAIDNRGSGLPRPGTFSKLPSIRPNRASTLIEPGTLTSPGASNGTTATSAKRNSVILPPGFNTSPQKSSLPFSPPRANRSSMLVKPGFKMASPTKLKETEELPESIDSIMASPGKASYRTSSPEEEIAQRRPRPSLSERTMESLASVPPSPSPAKRRQSGFFASESPMGPPSRTTSALGYSRPTSQMSFSAARGKDSPSPSKRTIPSHGRAQSTTIPQTNGNRMSMATKRSVSGGAGLKGPTIQAPSTTSRTVRPPAGLARPSTVANNRTSMIGAKPSLARPLSIKSPTKEGAGAPLGKPITKPGLARPQSLAYGRVPPNSQPRIAPPRSIKSPTPSTEQSADESISKSVTSSSQALRETIKQARQRMDKKSDNAFVPRAIAEEAEELSAFGVDIDPRSMDLQDSMHVNIIKKRINMAKSDGKLNISMLCLREIPVEVLRMYESGGGDDGGISWYEAVDITHLNAADNEFTDLPESIFAALTSGSESSSERDGSAGIFAGLEGIDLHANQLGHLPLTISGLTQLTSLNLSRNQLACTSIEVISGIQQLKELRLSQNKLNGPLPACIGNMQCLEILDLHGNILTELPDTLGKLSSLKYLDVSDNQLTSLPMSAIFDLHLIEINASRNKISETLIPANVPLVPYLQRLNLCTNSLTSLADAKIDFPALQWLDLSNNRVSALPNMSGWQKLTFINAEENKISEMPVGFAGLKELHHADFGNNSLLELDDAIGTMEKLTVLKIANNPIRERRLAKLTTEELKAELKGRSSTTLSPTSDRGRITPQMSSFAQAMAWTVNGDTLDRANSKLKTIERMDLEPLVHEGVRQCIFHHNQLQTIPQSLELFGSTLTSLDLSNNKLSKSPTFLNDPLALTSLQTLNLTLNGLVTLDPLILNLKAPKLATLIVTFNKLTALPNNPSLTNSFPALTKLVASNNKIVSLEVEALRGLQVLDVSSNEVEALPPKLALLEGTLRTLMINGNRFRVPSWSVIEKGTEEVLKWCRNKIPEGEEGAMES